MQLPDFHSLPTKTLAALFLSLTLAACGGSDGESRLDNFDDSNPGENGGSDEQPGENESAQLGRGSGDNFVAGEIEIGIPEESSLSPGGTTTLTVTLVNSAGELVTSPTDVTFNSDCIASGSSTLTVNGEQSGNSVTTNNGRAEITYQANGCAGDDLITARATLNEQSAGIARTTLTIESDTVQTLEFIGAEPELISLKGTGGRETSNVTFRVLGSTGSPMRNIEVTFSLRPTGVGGLSLVNTTATSNGSGEVSATVQAGTVATSVRVTAMTSGGVATQSNQLAVSTGLPDQNSVSLAASELYPVAWGFDGETSELTIRMADAFNNPVPDGTAVSFTTSGGSINGSCTTVDGACTVTWTSQNPRPIPDQGFTIDENSLSVVCPDDRECRPGRVQVLAFALGNESFVDSNSNGVYDHGKDIFLSDNASGQCNPNAPRSYANVGQNGCDDLGTAYLDKNFNGIRDEDEEIYALSADESGSEYESGGDGVYDGVLCSDASLAAEQCTRDSITVRDDQLIVMVCEQPYIMSDGGLPGQPENITLPINSTRSVDLMLADCNGNGMPAGTTVSIGGTLENAEVEVIPDGALAGSADPSIISIDVSGGEEPAYGNIRITITAPSPGGEISTTIGKPITVNN